MKIVTYNMQNNSKSKDNWASILEQEAPDIVLAQESLPPDKYQRPLLEKSWSENVLWVPVWPQWGSAVYVKSGHPRRLELPEYHGWVVGVELDDPAIALTDNPVRFFSLHAPSGLGSYHKVVRNILGMLQDYRDGCDVVVGGDFNLTVRKRHTSEDQKDEKVNLKIQARLRDEFGLINCWQTMHSDAPLAQTMRWDRDPNPAFHGDGIFVPESWASQLIRCEVLSGDKWVGLSDHNPVVAKFIKRRRCVFVVLDIMVILEQGPSCLDYSKGVDWHFLPRVF